MDPMVVEGYRQRLLAQRQQIVQRLLEIEEDLQTLTTEREIERMDHAQAEVPEEVLQKLDDQSRHEIEDIERALARIDAGTYGRCMACGQAIPTARLDALPMALRCAPCQARLERRV
jgi:DnaK suppressor protein